MYGDLEILLALTRGALIVLQFPSNSTSRSEANVSGTGCCWTVEEPLKSFSSQFCREKINSSYTLTRYNHWNHGHKLGLLR